MRWASSRSGISRTKPGPARHWPTSARQVPIADKASAAHQPQSVPGCFLVAATYGQPGWRVFRKTHGWIPPQVNRAAVGGPRRHTRRVHGARMARTALSLAPGGDGASRPAPLWACPLRMLHRGGGGDGVLGRRDARLSTVEAVLRRRDRVKDHDGRSSFSQWSHASSTFMPARS